MTRTSFDPNAAAPPDAGLFGLEPDPDRAAAVVVPVPFDATTSYRTGAAAGPELVRRASHQVDLFDRQFGNFWERGIHGQEPHPELLGLQAQAFPRARRVVAVGGRVAGDPGLEADLAAVNAAGAALNRRVRELAAEVLDSGRLPVLLGGDHAVPFGAIEAAAAAHPGLGVLHFDAHADLRQRYEGFEWSHASILRNVVERLDGVRHVVQVGIRDLCEEESDWIAAHPRRISTLFDDQWAAARLDGADLRALVRAQLAFLPQDVYLTFDVDGLDPALCPATGTPVPGGLSWAEAMLWLEELARSGKRIVGLDLVEVSGGPVAGASTAGEDTPDPWDAIVGARLLYRLIGCALATRG
jgi:agmatinase